MNESPRLESKEREKGANVEIVVKFMRHGERTKEGALLPLGREITRQRAKESGIEKSKYNAVKAIGSTAGTEQFVEDDGRSMARSLETAHIYAREIEGDDAFVTRGRDILSYETLVTSPPYDHRAIYNSFLPEHFNELEGEERITAARNAQDGVMKYLMELHTPEADRYRREIAGSFASLIRHYKGMTQKLNNDSKILIPAGSHGGTMEFLLQQALVRETEEGEHVEGFYSLEEIGGGFDPSESFNVRVATDDKGIVQRFEVSFDNPNRPQGTMYLDPEKITELADFYDELHEQNKK